LTKESFKELFDNNFDSLRNYIYYRSGNKELATDIAQDTFLLVWEKKIKPDPVRNKALLFKIAGNFFVDYCRKQKVATNFNLNVFNKDITVSPLDIIQYEELKKRYHKVLYKIPEKQRIVFLMNRVDNLTYNKIAECLNISVKAVEKRMKIALNILRRELID